MSHADCLTWQQNSNIGTAFHWVSLDPVIALHHYKTVKEYEALLQAQMHPVVQMLLPGDVLLHKMVMP